MMFFVLLELFFGGRVEVLQEVAVEVVEGETEHDETWTITENIQTT